MRFASFESIASRSDVDRGLDVTALRQCRRLAIEHTVVAGRHVESLGERLERVEGRAVVQLHHAEQVVVVRALGIELGAATLPFDRRHVLPGASHERGVPRALLEDLFEVVQRLAEGAVVEPLHAELELRDRLLDRSFPRARPRVVHAFDLGGRQFGLEPFSALFRASRWVRPAAVAAAMHS